MAVASLSVFLEVLQEHRGTLRHVNSNPATIAELELCRQSPGSTVRIEQQKSVSQDADYIDMVQAGTRALLESR